MPFCFFPKQTRQMFSKFVDNISVLCCVNLLEAEGTKLRSKANGLKVTVEKDLQTLWRINCQPIKNGFDIHPNKDIIYEITQI